MVILTNLFARHYGIPGNAAGDTEKREGGYFQLYASKGEADMAAVFS